MRGLSALDGKSLSIEGNLSEYSDVGADTIGYELQNMASSANKIVGEYPERFTKLDFKLFDPLGEKLLGEMHIFA